jgi:molybdopterin adenylyltransferase
MTNSTSIGFVTISDHASRADYEDRGGPAMQATLHDYLSSSWEPVARLIPDKQALIVDTLRELAEQEHCCLILTTGGTVILPPKNGHF